MSDYDTLPGLRWSLLKHLDTSPLHYRMARDAGPTPSTAAQHLGTAAHIAALEPDRWHDVVAIAPDVDRRTTAGKAAWAEFVEQSASRLVLKPDEAERALSMGVAVRSHPEARWLLAMGGAEVSLQWSEYGRAAKGRADWLDPVGGMLVDLKTSSQGLDARSVAATVARYGYHGQLAWYSRGVEALTGERPECYLVMVESSPPYDVAVYRVRGETLRRGHAMVERLLARLDECEERDEWPGQCPEAMDLELPGWAT